jgi:type I restriction enzyme, S subunit
MAIPPVHEQQAIVEMIKTQLSFLKELEKNSTKAIALLQERRTSLISAAVTGQIRIAD